jgi:RimJ/RimL family protein N-acetyltransferase
MITLQHFQKKDFTQLIQWINNEELMMNWSGAMFAFPLTEDSLDWYLSDVNDVEKSDAFVYSVIENDTGNVVGHISLGGISRKNNSARISRVFVAPESTGKGYGTAMIKAVLKIGFETLGLHRIALGVYTHNKAAIKCYQNAGMQIEGITRECLLYNNSYWSLAEMSILENEWKTLAQAAQG